MNTASLGANVRNLSDLHKDAYGFRPSPQQWALWNTMNDAQLDIEQTQLQVAVQAAILEEGENEAMAARHFEAYRRALPESTRASEVAPHQNRYLKSSFLWHELSHAEDGFSEAAARAVQTMLSKKEPGKAKAKPKSICRGTGSTKTEVTFFSNCRP
jgi:hypothetical protein